MSRIDTSKTQIVHDGRLYSLSPVKAFEVGKWYVYTETTAPLIGWGSTMRAVIDGEPRRCSSLGLGEKWQAAFDGLPGGWWPWMCGFENWREVVRCPGTDTPSALAPAKEPDGWQLGAWYRDSEDRAIFQIVDITPKGEGYQDRYSDASRGFVPYKWSSKHFQLLHSPTPIGEWPEGLGVSGKPAVQSHDLTMIDDVIPPKLDQSLQGAGEPSHIDFYDGPFPGLGWRTASCADLLRKLGIRTKEAASIEDRARSMLRDL